MLGYAPTCHQTGQVSTPADQVKSAASGFTFVLHDGSRAYVPRYATWTGLGTDNLGPCLTTDDFPPP